MKQVRFITIYVRTPDLVYTSYILYICRLEVTLAGVDN